MTGHNHYFDCTCGWCSGGYRGGSGGAGKIEIGCEWNSPKPATYNSYVDHNARCPECGQDVFFYQSPHGGRVFFDDLGVPWPKHSCTDRGSFSVRAAARHSIRFKHHDRSNEGWRPFVYSHVRKGDVADQFYVDQRYVTVARKFVFLPCSQFGDAPMLWKPSKVDASIDVTSISVGISEIDLSYEAKPFFFTTPIFAVSALHFAALTSLTELSGEQHNQIGRSLSFDIFATRRSRQASHPDLDLKAAASHFTLSAQLGCWKGSYNLGLLHLGSLGHPKDEAEAFLQFCKAAESREPLALQQLIECHRLGIGTEVNQSVAVDLEHKLHTQRVSLLDE